MSYRSEPFIELVTEAHLTPQECLEAAEYIARQARWFGIARRIEVRRSPSGLADDRHQSCARHGIKTSWVMTLQLSRSSETTTRVALRLDRGRRRPGGIVDGDAASAYAHLLGQALQAAARPRQAIAGNVIPLHPYALLGRLAS